ncbi:MAG: xylulokinase [Gammaproteobacteria bacterium]|nr:xylulokinase [Gammaproteobacteria bacterium]
MSQAFPATDGRACVAGVDLGAGSLKVSIVAASGRVAGSASRGYQTLSPHSGWSEQDPEDWWRAMCAAVPAALADAGVDARDIRAVAFCGGAHTPVLLDAADRLLRPAILWSDQRSSAEATELQQQREADILRITLNRPSPTWTLPQLMWLSRHEPAVLGATRRFMVAKDWLRWRVCGDWHTDVTDAVGTMLWDHAAKTWSAELAALAGIDLAALPTVVAPSQIVGTVTPDAAAACGLAAGTPVVCGTSDTSAEAYGAGADVAGPGVVKLATAATVSIVGTAPHVHPTLINYPFAIPGLWFTITATNSCASAHRWLRDRFFMRPGDDGGAVFAEMDRLAGEVPAGAGGLLFHPYLLGERAPYWDPLLRADFVGMTMRHDRGHFVRALYEGIAFTLRDVLDQFEARGLTIPQARIIGGGSRSALWRQIVADVLGVQVQLPERTDAAIGAALIAGVAVGLFPDERSAAQAPGGTVAVHDPDPVRVSRYRELHALYRETKERLTDINHRLHAFDH